MVAPDYDEEGAYYATPYAEGNSPLPGIDPRRALVPMVDEVDLAVEVLPHVPSFGQGQAFQRNAVLMLLANAGDFAGVMPMRGRRGGGRGEGVGYLMVAGVMAMMRGGGRTGSPLVVSSANVTIGHAELSGMLRQPGAKSRATKDGKHSFWRRNLSSGHRTLSSSHVRRAATTGISSARALACSLLGLARRRRVYARRLLRPRAAPARAT